MLYFIPAWYQQNQWCENEQKWYVRRTHTEFDDTVKQIQLFHRSKAYPYQIMLLSFAPNFRHFIHRQSVYHAPYWSCFDAIQGIRRKKAMVLSFHDLKWPSGIEFIHTPYVIIAMLNNEKYAKIEFGEDGNPIQIDMYKNNELCRRNLYDDRGFVSASIVYNKEKPAFQDYLMENGERKLRYYYADGHIEINPKHPEYLIQYGNSEYNKQFQKLSYSTFDEVIFEVLGAYLEHTTPQDLFCVAMHERHACLLKKALFGKKMIITFFESRYNIYNRPEALSMIENSGYIITDSQENSHKIRDFVQKEMNNISDITPYDSRVDFGISSQLNVQKILVPVDNIDETTFGKLIACLGEYLLINKNARIHLFTRRAEYNQKSIILEKTRNYLERAGYEKKWAIQEDNKTSENSLESEEDETGEKIPILFFVEQCVDELSVSKCMREQRLVVDMRNVAELYLRIAAISVGIPQIVHTETKFVEHGKNGFVLKDISGLNRILEYYLNSLNNWNEAMIYSYELGKKYTTEVLVEKWREVIDFVG